jgi:hypothetical protein
MAQSRVRVAIATAATLAAAMAAVGMAGALGAGCAAPTRMRRFPPSVFHAARIAARPAGPRVPTTAAAQDESAAMVVSRLHAAGLRFGTDGSARALWGYMRLSHRIVDAADARPGDILFFDTHSRQDQEPACADHAGIVEQVDPDGRITFIEARGGEIRRSYLHPDLPLRRRDERGEILNTFLRAKTISDPDGTRYFAGEMLCGVARARGH